MILDFGLIGLKKCKFRNRDYLRMSLIQPPNPSTSCVKNGSAYAVPMRMPRNYAATVRTISGQIALGPENCDT